jgi:hypothetical protein
MLGLPGFCLAGFCLAGLPYWWIHCGWCGATVGCQSMPGYGG